LVYWSFHFFPAGKFQGISETIVMESPLVVTVRSVSESRQITLQTTDTIETVSLYIGVLRFHYGIQLNADNQKFMMTWTFCVGFVLFDA